MLGRIWRLIDDRVVVEFESGDKLVIGRNDNSADYGLQ